MRWRYIHTYVRTEYRQEHGAAGPLALRIGGAAEIFSGGASSQVPNDQTPVIDADDVSDTSTRTRHHRLVLEQKTGATGRFDRFTQ